MNPSLCVSFSSTRQQMITTLASHLHQQGRSLLRNLRLFPLEVTSLFCRRPLLLMESCLAAPNQLGALFLCPSLHSHLFRLTCSMEQFPPPLQGGSHRQATVCPFFLFPLLLIPLHLHLSDLLHLSECHHVFHLLCPGSCSPYCRLLLWIRLLKAMAVLLRLSHCLLGLCPPNGIPFSHRQTFQL